MIRIAIIFIEREDGALFVHQRRPDKRVFPSLFGVGAGGRIEPGETPFEGAQRELREETGITTPIAPVADFLFGSPIGQYEVHIFHVLAEQVPSPCTEEWTQWSWMPPHDVAKLMADDLLCPDTAEGLRRWPGYAPIASSES
ncbi:MAG: NUDIX domain-containing protein [Proteobacteria bacterium]|nr:NUDIX domain-containing protein [Pseudomonadota bacterium]